MEHARAMVAVVLVVIVLAVGSILYPARSVGVLLDDAISQPASWARRLPFSMGTIIPLLAWMM